MLWKRTERGVFADPPVPLTSVQEKRAKTAALRAAREARRSLGGTARKQYRRYRQNAGATYLDWPRWHEAYLREYGSRTFGGYRANDISVESGGGGF